MSKFFMQIPMCKIKNWQNKLQKISDIIFDHKLAELIFNYLKGARSGLGVYKFPGV